MKILISCDSYFQLIVALQMRLTICKNDQVTIVISDHSRSSMNVVKKLRSQYVFDDVLYYESKHFCYDKLSLSEKFRFIFTGITGHGLNEKAYNRKYDQFIYYNNNFTSISLFSKLYSVNKTIIPIRMEEGIGTYSGGFNENTKIRIITGIRDALRRKCLKGATSIFYCFSPALYNGELKAEEIPQIEKDSVLVKILKDIFMDDGIDYSFPHKYVFLGSIFDREKKTQIGEHAVVRKVVDILGKDNLMLKLHPRDDIMDYEKSGVYIYRESQVPWEIIQLTEDMTDKVILTAASTSALSLNLLIDSPCKILLLHGFCDFNNNSESMSFMKLINLFNDKHIDLEKYNIYSIDSLDSIMQY